MNFSTRIPQMIWESPASFAKLILIKSRLLHRIQKKSLLLGLEAGINLQNLSNPYDCQSISVSYTLFFLFVKNIFENANDMASGKIAEAAACSYFHFDSDLESWSDDQDRISWRNWISRWYAFTLDSVEECSPRNEDQGFNGGDCFK